MKKPVSVLILLIPILFAVSFGGLSLYARAAEGGDDESAHRTGKTDLFTADYSLIVDEALSRVGAYLVFHNSGSSEIRTSVPLPLLSNGAKRETLSLEASKEILLSEDLDLYFELLPGESLTLSYDYETAASLVNATAIAADFRGLVFREDGKIGHFRIELLLDERDIALVRDVVPGNFALQNNVVSVELWDFAVSNLISSFCLTKESWRGLLGSREYDPNEDQRKFLKRAEEAFNNPDSFRFTPGEPDGSFFRIYGKLMGITDEFETNDSFYRLTEGTYTFANILTYLTAREYRRQFGTGIFADRDFLSEVYTRYLNNTPPLLEEYIRQLLYDEPLMTAVVLFSREPTLKGVTLYTARVYGDDYSNVEFNPGDELAIVRTLPSGFSYAGFQPDGHRIRHILISEDTGFTTEELADYLDAVHADVLFRQMLLDNRDGKWDYLKILDSGETYPTYGLFSCPPSGSLSGDTLYRVIYDNSSYMQNSVRVIEREDALLSGIAIPCFTRYWGIVREYQGVTQAVDFVEGSYMSAWYGVTIIPPLLRDPEVVKVLDARDARQDGAERSVTALLQDTAEEPGIPVQPSQIPEGSWQEEEEPPSGTEDPGGEAPGEEEHTAESESREQSEAGEEEEPGDFSGDYEEVLLKAEQNRKARFYTGLFLGAGTFLLAVIFVILILMIRPDRSAGNGTGKSRSSGGKE